MRRLWWVAVLLGLLLLAFTTGWFFRPHPEPAATAISPREDERRPRRGGLGNPGEGYQTDDGRPKDGRRRPRRSGF